MRSLLAFYFRNMGKGLRATQTITPEKWNKSSVLGIRNGRKSPLLFGELEEDRLIL